MAASIAAIVVPLILVIVFGVLILYIIFVRRRRSRGQFKHRRMEGDDEEIHNPVFLHGEEDEAIFGDEATNFANPMYENVYNDTVTSSEPGSDLEHHGLLARGHLEIKD